jgi:ABC-2 type transport system permease protein
MLKLLIWEFGKLIRLRSVQLGLAVALVLPVLWALAPGLRKIYQLELASGWQVPALSLFTGIEYLFPFLVAIAAAEIMGSEVSTGTLKSLLLRPSSRTRLLGAKLIWVLLYPIALMLVSMIGSLIAGLPFGLGSFAGGTGLGTTGFVGEGFISPLVAFREVLTAHILAAFTLWPLATLSLLFAVVFLSTTSGALAAVSTLLLMRLLVAFPGVQFFLLTTYLSLFYPEGQAQIAATLISAGATFNPAQVFPIGVGLLLTYTIGFAALAILIFERKDI